MTLRTLLMKNKRGASLPDNTPKASTYRPIGIAMLVAGGILLATGCLLVARDGTDEGRYVDLAISSIDTTDKSPTASEDGATGIGSRDWDGLLAQVPDAAAWVRVGGTTIDYPVAVPPPGEGSGFYLTHDIWGNRSAIGSPYLEEGSQADGTHSLVYGHHCGTTGRMFSPLADRWCQDSFDRLGNMTWSTKAGGDQTLVPLCAMTVDKTYPNVLKFDFTPDDGSELSGWLRSLCADASAKATGWESLCDGADKTVSLVTCTSVVPGQPQRTVVVFVREGGDAK